MPAETGAIYHISTGKSGFDCTVLGGGEARGLCGSGLADGVAVLLATGTLKPSGRFAISPGSDGHELLAGNPRSAITAGDVDAFQRAKAATAAAMEELLGIAGMDWCDIRRLCVCGAFGRHLDIGHAQQVGLLPSIDADRVELFADATLAGCEKALLCGDSERQFAALAKTVNLVNLSYSAKYDDRYIDHLRLKPIPPTFQGVH
jgi:uncharacterized 2Fe-2S/4Fe-4S cluster protein (DUF4445 family)